MKILNKILFGTFVVGAFAFSSAQKIDAKSKEILDVVTKNYNSNKNTFFEIVFGSGTNGKVTRTEDGTFYSSGDKYRLSIMGTDQIFDGNKIYNINDEDMEVTIAKPNENDQVFSPINYLSTYRKNFNVTYVGKRNVNGKNTDFIVLTPIKSNGLKSVFLFVDSTNKQLVKLEQHGTNKDIAVIAITNYKKNQTINSEMFKFDKSKYADYIITEL